MAYQTIPLNALHCPLPFCSLTRCMLPLFTEDRPNYLIQTTDLNHTTKLSTEQVAQCIALPSFVPPADHHLSSQNSEDSRSHIPRHQPNISGLTFCPENSGMTSSCIPHSPFPYPTLLHCSAQPPSLLVSLPWRHEMQNSVQCLTQSTGGFHLHFLPKGTNHSIGYSHGNQYVKQQFTLEKKCGLC